MLVFSVLCLRALCVRERELAPSLPGEVDHGAHRRLHRPPHLLALLLREQFDQRSNDLTDGSVAVRERELAPSLPPFSRSLSLAEPLSLPPSLHVPPRPPTPLPSLQREERETETERESLLDELERLSYVAPSPPCSVSDGV